MFAGFDVSFTTININHAYCHDILPPRQLNAYIKWVLFYHHVRLPEKNYQWIGRAFFTKIRNYEKMILKWTPFDVNDICVWCLTNTKRLLYIGMAENMGAFQNWLKEVERATCGRASFWEWKKERFTGRWNSWALANKIEGSSWKKTTRPQEGHPKWPVRTEAASQAHWRTGNCCFQASGGVVAQHLDDSFKGGIMFQVRGSIGHSCGKFARSN